MWFEKLRRKIISHNVIMKKHYITLFNRISFPFHVEKKNGFKYVVIDGMSVKYKKMKNAKDNIALLPEIGFEFLPPKMAYMMEDKITYDMKKHYCEQKAYEQLHYFPDIDRPKSFNEKLLWLALNYQNPAHAAAADKARAKRWIADQIGEEYVVSLIGAYSNVNDIDFDKLPDKFVMKSNGGWGAGQVVVIKDKSKYDYDRLRALASSWLFPWSSYYYNNMCITDEKIDKPLVVIEELLEDGTKEFLDDYKLYVCNGKVKFSLIVTERGSKAEKRTFVDANWNILPVRRAGKFSNTLPKKPENYEKMAELAEILAKDFPLVRIDFYNINGKIYVGEMTFVPGLFLRFEPKAWDFRLGDFLDISELQRPLF